MFFVYLLGVSAIGVACIILWHYLIYLFIKEFDKRTYIHGYKKDCGKFSKVVAAIYELVTFYSLVILTPIGIVYLGTTGMLRKRKAYMFARYFVTTPILIASFIAIGNVGFHYIITALNLELFLPFYEYFLKFIIKLDIIFYGVLCIKLMRFSYASENVTIEKFKDQLPEYKSKRELWKKIRNTEIEEEFSTDFCLRYNSVEEWQASQHYQQTYGVMYKVLNIYSPAIVLVICILYVQTFEFFLPYKFLRVKNSLDLLFYGSVADFRNWNIYYQYATIFVTPIYTLATLVYLFNILFNERTKNKLKLLPIQILIGILCIIGLINIVGTNVQDRNKVDSIAEDSDYFTLREVNQLAVNAIKHSKNFEDYTLDEKIYYLIEHPHKLKKQLKETNIEKVKYKNFEYIHSPDTYTDDDVVDDMEELEELFSKNEYACNTYDCQIAFSISNPVYKYIYIKNSRIILYTTDYNQPPEYFWLNNTYSTLSDEEINFVKKLFPSKEVNDLTKLQKEAIKSVVLDNRIANDDEDYTNYTDAEIRNYIKKRVEIYEILDSYISPIFDEVIND